MAMKKLESEFELAMRDIYRRAKIEANYNANRFLQMIENEGGLETARILLHSQHVSDGYMGEYDFVGIAEFPSDEAQMTNMMSVISQGGVKGTTLKAFSLEEYTAIVNKLP